MNIMTRQHIRESNLIEGFDDPAIDEASWKAWEWLKKHKVVTHDVIRRLQEKLVAHQTDLQPLWRGTYRDRSRVRVRVGLQNGTPPERVRKAMDEWLIEFYALSPKESHIAFEKIHPFVDGNGRTGRMLMWWREKQLDIPYTLIKSENRYDYYNWFL